jgi:DNA-directed RNA polymerase specialized sigma24 family protein
MTAASTRELLIAAIGELPLDDQQVLQLRYVEACTTAELAAVLGVSLIEAEARYGQAMSALREHFPIAHGLGGLQLARE